MKNKWGSVIRKLGLFLLCFLMAACSIDMDTQLDLKDDQSGQRIITISVGKDAIEDYGSDELEKIEQVLIINQIHWNIRRIRMMTAMCSMSSPWRSAVWMTIEARSKN